MAVNQEGLSANSGSMRIDTCSTVRRDGWSPRWRADSAYGEEISMVWYIKCHFPMMAFKPTLGRIAN